MGYDVNRVLVRVLDQYTICVGEFYVSRFVAEKMFDSGEYLMDLKRGCLYMSLADYQ